MISKLGNCQIGMYPSHTLSFEGQSSKPVLDEGSDTLELSAKQEKKDKRTKLALIGVAILSIGAIAFAIYKHKNPTKSLGSAGDNLTNTGSRASSAGEGAERTAEKGAGRKAEDVLDDAEEKARKAAEDEQKRLAKEAEEAKKAEQERLAKEAEKKAEEERLAREAQEKAQKEALEKKVEQMKDDLNWYANGLIDDLKSGWKDEAARLTRLFETAEKKGFESLKGNKSVLPDGTHVIEHSNTKSSKFTYKYYSKDGKHLDEVIAFKDGEKYYSSQLDNPNNTGYYETVSIARYDKNGKDFKTVSLFDRDRKNPILYEWRKCNNTDHEGVITYIQRANDYDGIASYEIGFNGPNEYGRSSFWIKKPV